MGPKHHDFNRDLPRTMKRLALRSALSSQAADGGIIVVEGLVPAQPRTRDVVTTLAALDVTRRALLVTGEHEPTLARAGGNIQTAKVLPAANLNVVDVLNAHSIVVTEDAVRKIEALWGGLNVKPARGRRVAEEAANA
jgi:large subunit ribosomal protein L4